jgi:SagB-type dehydrogenase family enzyme
MSKLGWVLLPLLAVGIGLAVAAWRGRLPTRLALNVGFSLLLLVYLATTAGLGIFWVANQHLPVFDWHYLFGYATVLLLAVHLGFNLRVVGRFLFPPRRTPPAPAQHGAPAVTAARPDPRRGRLSLLAALGVGAALGGAYWLGLRHGRTELRIEAAGGGTAGMDPAGAVPRPALPPETARAIVRQFHEFSSHSRLGVFRRAASVEWGDPPPPFKAYPQAEVLALPAVPRSVATRARSDPAADATPRMAADLAMLSTLLWHTAAVNLQRGPIHFRTAPSSGALFAAEFYVVVQAADAGRRDDALPGGIWHYDGQRHRLQRVAPASSVAAADWALAPAGGLCVIATALWRRSGHKYRDRSYRYVLADLGHGLENLRVAAEAGGATLGFVPVFDEARVAARLGLDQSVEGPLAWLTLMPASAPDAAPADLPLPAARPRPVGWTVPAMPAGSRLGVTDAIHQATSLQAADGAAPALLDTGWTVRVTRAVVSRPAPPVAPAVTPPATPTGTPTLTPTAAVRLPAPRVSPMPPLRQIAERRSMRRYTGRPLPLPVLAALLDAAAVRHGAWLSEAVRIHLVAQAVEGLPVGAWRFSTATRSLAMSRQIDEVRRRSRRAGLDQDVIGDAAVVFVLTIARRILEADLAGAARGYRHAFLEAGVLGERFYLEATAQGLGVCGVGAFYDDEASELIAVDPADEWVVHFVAVGWLD